MCRIRMGLKPIPHQGTNANKKTQNKEQLLKPNQRRKEKGKEKERETPQDNNLLSENLGLSNNEITMLLASNVSQTEQHEHIAKIIHNQAKEKLTNKIPAQVKLTNPPLDRTSSEMEVDDHSQSPSQ